MKYFLARAETFLAKTIPRALNKYLKLDRNALANYFLELPAPLLDDKN